MLALKQETRHAGTDYSSPPTDISKFTVAKRPHFSYGLSEGDHPCVDFNFIIIITE